jgi:hypothetical protein
VHARIRIGPHNDLDSIFTKIALAIRAWLGHSKLPGLCDTNTDDLAPATILWGDLLQSIDFSMLKTSVRSGGDDGATSHDDNPMSKIPVVGPTGDLLGHPDHDTPLDALCRLSKGKSSVD